MKQQWHAPARTEKWPFRHLSCILVVSVVEHGSWVHLLLFSSIPSPGPCVTVPVAWFIIHLQPAKYRASIAVLHTLSQLQAHLCLYNSAPQAWISFPKIMRKRKDWRVREGGFPGFPPTPLQDYSNLLLLHATQRGFPWPSPVTPGGFNMEPTHQSDSDANLSLQPLSTGRGHFLYFAPMKRERYNWLHHHHSLCGIA